MAVNVWAVLDCVAAYLVAEGVEAARPTVAAMAAGLSGARGGARGAPAAPHSWGDCGPPTDGPHAAARALCSLARTCEAGNVTVSQRWLHQLRVHAAAGASIVQRESAYTHSLLLVVLASRWPSAAAADIVR